MDDPLFIEPKFDKSDTITIIQLYKSHPVLWDIKDPLYRRQNLKALAYNDIAKQMHMSVESVKKKLKSLRSTYTGEKRKMFYSKNKPDGEKYITSLSWYNEMRFLDSLSPIRKPVESIIDSDNESRISPEEDESSHDSQLKKDNKKELKKKQQIPCSLEAPLIINRQVKRYMVKIPKILLNIKTADKEELSQRYASLGIPSEFFLADMKWSECFTPEKPFSLRQPCKFRIITEMMAASPNAEDIQDANHLYSAKVMLLELPPIDEIYKKCFENDDDPTHRPTHPWRLINFLVGVNGDVETMAIGGPWSALLDGENPHKDPSVLIRTAIRTCKTLTGIDLANCTQWHRFLEIHYHRQDGKEEDDYVETVVIYLPELHSIIHSEEDEQVLNQEYRDTNDDNDVEMRDGSSILNDKAADEEKKKAETMRKDTTANGVVNNETDDEVIIIEAVDPLEISMECSSATKMNNKQQDSTQSSHGKVASALPFSPQVIVSPNRMAKGANFNCVVKSLSALLDYHPDDLKESSFEISLFAELFNDMLTRDFGLNIYKKLNFPKEPKIKNKVSEITVEQNEMETEIKQEFIDNADENFKTLNDKKTGIFLKNCAQANQLQSSTIYKNIINPDLLMSFTYFDITHTGYIIGKDLEDLLYILGLNLSRSQIKEVLQKWDIINADVPLHYRKLTHKQKPLECTPTIKIVNMANIESAIKIDDDDNKTDTDNEDTSSDDSDCKISTTAFSDKEIILALIEEYSKLQEQLKATAQELYNCKHKQRDDLCKILTSNLNESLNVNLSFNMVKRKLIFVCNLYESEIERRITEGQNTNSGYQWLYDKMSFLEDAVVTKLKLQMNLLDDQIVYDIIDIYKDYKSLWDTNHSAYFNHRNRSENMHALLKEIKKKLNLFLDFTQLEQQLHYIHKSFAKDKKLRLECKNKQQVFQPTFPCFYKCHFLENHESPFTCPTCNFTTESKHLFKNHKHSRSRSHLCAECGKSYETVKMYQHHLRKHLIKKSNAKRKKKIRCQFCTKTFSTKGQSQQHIKSHERSCKICNAYFTNEESYSQHMKWHKEKPRYFCHICQEGFFLKISLQNHLKRHDGEINNTCDICDKTFFNPLSLFTHKDRVHGDLFNKRKV